MLDLIWTTQILSDMFYCTALSGQINIHPLDTRKHHYFEFVGVIRDRAKVVELNSHRRWRNSFWVTEETVGNCGIVRGTVGQVHLSMSAGVTLNTVESVLVFINKWSSLLSESHIRVFSQDGVPAPVKLSFRVKVIWERVWTRKANIKEQGRPKWSSRVFESIWLGVFYVWASRLFISVNTSSWINVLVVWLV